MKAKYFKASELAKRQDIPDIFQTNNHLIYSSPATLAYNSPGAQGFGVKRAGLSVPESVMLIVSPGCCGRNTSAITTNDDYKHRYFYYLMDETDIVTGRHLAHIPQAVKEVVESLEVKPKVVMICITCVDALLGTDMERVCRKCEALVAGVKVKPCYMYALTREGRKPPMVHVRESIYSLLEKKKRHARHVNLLGFFAPLNDQSELYCYLGQLDITKINEISRMKTYEEFEEMACANFNLILHPEARAAASDLEERLGIGSIELSRFYDLESIHRQYQAFFQVFQKTIDDKQDYHNALKAYESLPHTLHFAIGETLNADSFELAYALLKQGFHVSAIYATYGQHAAYYVKEIAKMSPDTRIYCNNEPSMLYYDMSNITVDITLGKDAAYYHPHARHVFFNEDIQPYGYQGVIDLCTKIGGVL